MNASSAKAALVLGGGACLFDDLQELHQLVDPWPGLVIAANDARVCLAWSTRSRTPG